MSTEPTRSARDWIGPLVVLTLVTGIWIWQGYSDEATFVDMPEDVRRGLYLRTLENLRTVCPAPSDPVRTEFCREQADLLLRLPECDGECRELARRHTNGPAR